MNALAAIRPDEWNLPLFLHILGAMVMVGALVTACYFLLSARRDGSLELTRLGFRTLLFAALPSFIVMRVAAAWILSKEPGLEDADPAWIGIGFITSDAGLLLILISTAVTGLALRRARGAVPGAAIEGRAPAVAAWLTAFLVVAYVIAIWAMTTKPA